MNHHDDAERRVAGWTWTEYEPTHCNIRCVDCGPVDLIPYRASFAMCAAVEEAHDQWHEAAVEAAARRTTT